MEKAAGVTFFIAWLLCGCSIDSIADDFTTCAIFFAAFIVCAITAALITKGDE